MVPEQHLVCWASSVGSTNRAASGEFKSSRGWGCRSRRGPHGPHLSCILSVSELELSLHYELKSYCYFKLGLNIDTAISKTHCFSPCPNSVPSFYSPGWRHTLSIKESSPSPHQASYSAQNYHKRRVEWLIMLLFHSNT